MMTPEPRPSNGCACSCGALSPKYFFSSSGIFCAGDAVPSTCTLTTAGNTFSSIGARLGNAPWPGTCVGKDAAAGGKADNDNPTLNANALNSKVCLFIRCWLS